MTAVRMMLSRPRPDGTTAPVDGWVEWTPTRRRTVGDEIVLPIGFSVAAAEVVMVVVAPTGPGWCWRVAERVSQGITRHVEVPDVAEVGYEDLVDVDPSTLEPVGPPPVDVWAAALDDATAAASAAAEAARTDAESAASSATSSAAAAQNAADVNATNYDPAADWSGNVSLAGVARSAILHRTLTGNVVITALPATPVAGQTVTLVLIQDGVGSRTLTFPGVKWAYGVAPVLSTAAGSIDVIHLWWSGAVWVGAVMGQAVA